MNENNIILNTSDISGVIDGNVVDYTLVSNKPKINNVTLSGNKSLSDLGIDIPTKVSDLDNDSGFITGYTETDPVFTASVASTITAEDITKWNNQSGGTSDYSDLTNKPSINNVELSGNKSLGDLGINIPTKTSDLTNDSGFTTFSGNYNDLSNKPTIPVIPTNISAFTNDSGYITSYTETDPVFSASPSAGITNQDITNWNNKSTFSGNYNDLTNKPTIPTVPSNVSAFTNDAGYLTTHQDITGKLDTSKVKSSTSTTSGDVYDVTYINSMLGDIESLLGGI